MDNQTKSSETGEILLCGDIPCEDCDFFICCTNFEGLCDKCLMSNMACLPILKIRSAPGK